MRLKLQKAGRGIAEREKCVVGKAGWREKKIQREGRGYSSTGPSVPSSISQWLGGEEMCGVKHLIPDAFYSFYCMLFLLVLPSPILRKKGQDYIDKDVLQAST